MGSLCTISTDTEELGWLCPILNDKEQLGWFCPTSADKEKLSWLVLPSITRYTWLEEKNLADSVLQ